MEDRHPYGAVWIAARIRKIFIESTSHRLKHSKHSVHSLFFFFNKYSQSTYYGLGILLGTRDREMNEGLALMERTVSLKGLIIAYANKNTNTSSILHILSNEKEMPILKLPTKAASDKRALLNEWKDRLMNEGVGRRLSNAQAMNWALGGPRVNHPTVDACG